MKKLIIIIMASSVVACALFLILFLKSATSEATVPGETISGSEQRLQSQINDLSAKISAFNNLVTRIQSQTAPGTSTASSPDQQAVSQIDAASANVTNLLAKLDSLQLQIADSQKVFKGEDVKNLTDKVDSLQAQVAELQERLKVAETSIGNTPVTVDGLSIVFISKDVEIGTTGSSIPNAAQFAVKIINTTSSTLTSIDVTGIIISSQALSEGLASGYPQLTDGSGLCTYVFFIKQDKTLHFEAFGNGKTSLSIPAGGSITLRPKLSVLATANAQLPPIYFNLALETITFDRAAAK